MANTYKFRFSVIAGLAIFGALAASSAATASAGKLIVKNASGRTLNLTFTVDGAQQDLEAIANDETKEVKGDNLAVCIQAGSTNVGYARVNADKKTTVWWSTTRLSWEDFQDRNSDLYEIKKVDDQSGKNKKTIKIVGNVNAPGTTWTVNCK